MVANDNSRGIGSDDDMPMTSLSDDVTTGHGPSITDFSCPHCTFRCSSPTIMTQHSWEEHPLLMRRKKHLITSPRNERPTSSKRDVVGVQSVESPPPVNETAQEMKKCSLSGSELSQTYPDHCLGSSRTQQNRSFNSEWSYRSEAARSLSLLSTAAAILDAQGACAPQRHVAVVRPVPVKDQVGRAPSNIPRYTTKEQPSYNAYLPGFNQYVGIPIPINPALPSPTILNASLENAMKVYLNTQNSSNTQTVPLTQNSRPEVTPPCPAPKRKPADEIRTLLQSTPAARKVSPQSNIPNETRIKLEQTPMEQNRPPQPCTLGKERLRELEEALLTTDCLDINDSSTTMPFKCADGVWRMVTFKCVRGLWVVQTPDSSTPTVYVPWAGDKRPEGVSGVRPGTSGSKRKRSEDVAGEVDAKRLCASAPIVGSGRGGLSSKGTSLKRTRSNPFISKSLPPPRRLFTNIEGKRVNISMIRKTSAQPSCSLIKSLLLRKTARAEPVTSLAKATPCKSASARHLVGNFNVPGALTKNAMAF